MSGNKGLKEWFKQDWRDISSKKKMVAFAKCGRTKQKKDAKRKYPKCVPAAKAAAMSKGQIKSAVSRKRAAGNVDLNPQTLKQLSRKKLAEKIKDDVINWSKNVLEPMNKHLGFPACPFAAKWRKDGKIKNRS